MVRSLHGARPGLALWTVNVDLRRVPQADYAFLRQGERVSVSGERVSVSGVLSADRRRLAASSLVRVEGTQEP